MREGHCPFCSPEPGRVFYQSDVVVGLWDGYPVSDGHALLVTRRHVAEWFDATADERRALTLAIDVAKTAVAARGLAPDGFNIGVNVGAAAGQTVPHLHVHVIPRYVGDVADPRGGVRHVIPSRGNYLSGSGVSDSNRDPRQPYLLTGDSDPLLPHLVAGLAWCRDVDMVVSFVMESGVLKLLPHFGDLLARGGRLRLLTGDYMDVTDPDALLHLLDLQGNVQLRVFETASIEGGASQAFHPKSYLFQRPDGQGSAFVGSSNLSASALTNGIEWNYRVVSSSDSAGFGEVCNSFERLFRGPRTQPLTAEWVEAYRTRRAAKHLIRVPSDETIEEVLQVPEPNEIQRDALAALEATRANGNKTGLVVLATGLGKTWLAAFDSAKPAFPRVLFVAHREEILAQALDTYRRIRPSARLGRYAGQERDATAEVLFASIQTLSRREHIERFARDAFDYIVIDEFHHAAATSYRRLIEYFEPAFLLGLTATPERTDGGDLLTLCQQNLVYRCDVVEGVRRNLLSPFRYFGVPDNVDYANIPWRNSHFDEEALTTAVATQARAENAFEQLKSRGGNRTLAFCVSMRHANFMASFFQARGVRAVAVHSGVDSAPRAASLERLAAGDLDVVCAVDMFNEGVDLPTLDTVMMLRPTESKILWLQQFGRGLRRVEGKDRLTVIDYIGNHRVFLLKPQTLFGLPSGDGHVLNLLERLKDGTQELPPGCEVTYDLEAVDILRGLLRRTTGDAFARFYGDFKGIHGTRPTAPEAYQEGYNPRSVRKSAGSWLGFLSSQNDLDGAEATAFESHRAFLEALDTTEMTKSYKMLVLLAMLNADRLPGSISVDDLADEVARVAGRTTRAAADLGERLKDKRALIKLLEGNPIAAWTEGRGTGDVAYFKYRDRTFSTVFDVAPACREGFQQLVREIADWRLAEYLDRAVASGAWLLKVSHANGRPVISLPEESRSELPNDWTLVTCGNERLEANFVKAAIDVARREGGDANELPRVLRGWFGADAGAPGTRHEVKLENRAGKWVLTPVGAVAGALQRWRAYSREQIPPLFGFEFSTAVWNVGFVNRDKHMFLLTTLDKSGHASDFQYADHFLSSTEFQWQSQNRTAQEDRQGQNIRHHVGRGTAVHLFVRSQKKTGDGRSAPFVYCGDVDFERWEGNKPITVVWTLREPVPERLWSNLGISAASV